MAERKHASVKALTSGARTLKLRLENPVVLLAQSTLPLIDRLTHNIAHLRK
jgi:hypothetical protein